MLITRLIANEAEAYSVRVGDERYAPITTGFGSGLPYAGYGWGGYYTLAFQNKMWGYNINGAAFMTQIKKLVMANNIDRAIKLCNAGDKAALARVVKSGLAV